MKHIDPSMCTHINSLQISPFRDMDKCLKTFGAYYNILLLKFMRLEIKSLTSFLNSIELLMLYRLNFRYKVMILMNNWRMSKIFALA